MPYGEAKDELFHKCGITVKSASEKLFKLDMEKWMKRDTTQTVNDIYRQRHLPIAQQNLWVRDHQS